ncbi:MAG TPA: hypothetical protein VF698_12515, partial [Thermoanaerobaculia bacterium]
MTIATLPRLRYLTVIAQDPVLTYKREGPMKGRIVTARIRIPAEALNRGPQGYRVHCIDYDATSDTYYDTHLPEDDDPFDLPVDLDADEFNRRLLSDPNFHCQNVYTLVMHTLQRFEFALGRRLKWGFEKGHQLKVAPHAFSEANAFYSEEDQALLFGYFPSLDEKTQVFTCLSHDVIVHETTHALIDGLRTRFTDPSSPDQAAFHEGFADVVALLSIFSLPSIAEVVLDNNSRSDARLINANALKPDALRAAIGSLANQVGEEVAGVRGQPLRNSMQLLPGRNYLEEDEFLESHRRGEILAAAMMNAFLEIWSRRLEKIGEKKKGMLDRSKVVEEGADIADALLTSVIRALDYCPPVHLSFSDYVSALVTADNEIRPGSDDRYELRATVLKSFAAYGIKAASNPETNGLWEVPDKQLTYERTHFEPMQRDEDEVFHFLWENFADNALSLNREAFTYVQSVRPCVRVGPDGFMLRETVAEYVQVLKVRASELGSLKLTKPAGMDDALELTLYGGGALIFDEYGKVKYHVYNPVCGSNQNARIEYLFRFGFYSGKSGLRFSGLHRMRA